MTQAINKKYKQGRPENGGHSHYRFWVLLKDGSKPNWGITRDSKKKGDPKRELEQFKLYFDKLNSTNDIAICRIYENLPGGKGEILWQWTSKNPHWHAPDTYRNGSAAPTPAKQRSKLIAYLRFNDAGMVFRRENNIKPMQTAYIFSKDMDPELKTFNWYSSFQSILADYKENIDADHILVAGIYEQLPNNQSRLVARLTKDYTYDFEESAKDLELKVAQAEAVLKNFLNKNK